MPFFGDSLKHWGPTAKMTRFLSLQDVRLTYDLKGNITLDYFKQNYISGFLSHPHQVKKLKI